MWLHRIIKYIEGRLYVISVRSKQLLRHGKTSWPYLSPDAFASLADVQIFKPKFSKKNLSNEDILRAKVIFCPSDHLSIFLAEYRGLISPKVIISGNSDFEFHDIPRNIPESVRILLLQNSFISDNKRIFTLPIGVENFRLGVNGHPKLFQFSPITLKARGRLLIGPFSSTHSVRKEIKERFSRHLGNWLVLETPIKPRKYGELIKKEFEYVLCARGNGVDTHRLWEALYRGRKAIIANDDWSKSLLFLQPFVSLVNDWEISTLKNVMVNNKSDFDPKDIPELWMPYWKQFVQSAKDQN
jgi:hypothetical protein